MSGWGKLHRQRNSFNARVKHTISQAPKNSHLRSSCAKGAPCSILARKASIVAVNGKRLDNRLHHVREAL